MGRGVQAGLRRVACTSTMCTQEGLCEGACTAFAFGSCYVDDVQCVDIICLAVIVSTFVSI